MATVKKRNGSYLIRCSAGYNLEGKQIRKSMTWTPDKKMTPTQERKALEDVIYEFEKKVKQGIILDGNIRFADYAQNWIDKAEKHNRLAPKTILHYKNLLSRINQEIGNIRLNKLRSHHLNDLYDKLTADGLNARGGKLSPKTIREHHVAISSILSSAVKDDIIFDNPAKRADAPKLQYKEQPYLDEIEAVRVIELLADEEMKYRTAIIMLIYSGIRRGELCGLKWDDIDFDNHIIHIRRITQYLPGIGIIEKEPKTPKSIRPIKLAPEAFALLEEHKEWQEGQREYLGTAWIDNNYVFTQWNGKAIHPDTLTTFFSKFAKKHKLPAGTKLHSLRHTNATLLIASGVPHRTVSNRLGHAQTSTTTNIYAHAIRSADEMASEVIGDLLNPTKNLKKKIDNA